MSTVYFADMRTGHKENLFDKIARLLLLTGLKERIAENDLTAIKIHFGEKGTTPLSGRSLPAGWWRRYAKQGGSPF